MPTDYQANTLHCRSRHCLQYEGLRVRTLSSSTHGLWEASSGGEGRGRSRGWRGVCGMFHGAWLQQCGAAFSRACSHRACKPHH